MTDLAKAQLKSRWGTMKKVLSSQSRLEKIVADILLDMETRDRLKSGLGNAILVSGSIYQACKFFELFSKTGLAGQCAIVTSYRPLAATIKGEDSGEGPAERLRQFEIYRKMLADWFNDTPENAANRVEEFEKAVKKRFIDEPTLAHLPGVRGDALLRQFAQPVSQQARARDEASGHRVGRTLRTLAVLLSRRRLRGILMARRYGTTATVLWVAASTASVVTTCPNSSCSVAITAR